MNFIEEFNLFKASRADDIYSKKLAKNKVYVENNDNYYKIYEQIRKALPVEHQNLMDEYEEAMVQLQAIIDDVIYQEGLKDGVALAEILEIKKETKEESH